MIDVELDMGVVWGNSNFGHSEVEKAVDAAVRFAGLPGLAEYRSPVEVSIKLTNDAEVQALNREWRDKDKPTNVLSFPMLEEDALEQLRHPELVSGSYFLSDAEKIKTLKRVQGDEQEMEMLLGDIILAYETCAAEATEKDIPIAHHATHLVIHGMLHLLGHDHIEDDEAELMEALEVKALASMGLPNPYNA
jgi:probable rRNA maturation factor